MHSTRIAFVEFFMVWFFADFNCYSLALCSHFLFSWYGLNHVLFMGTFEDNINNLITFILLCACSLYICVYEKCMEMVQVELCRIGQAINRSNRSTSRIRFSGSRRTQLLLQKTLSRSKSSFWFWVGSYLFKNFYSLKLDYSGSSKLPILPMTTSI